MKINPLNVFMVLISVNLMMYWFVKMPWIFQATTLLLPIVLLYLFYNQKVARLLKEENIKKYNNKSINFKTSGLTFINPFTLFDEPQTNDSEKLRKAIKFLKLYLLLIFVSFVWLVAGNIITTVQFNFNHVNENEKRFLKMSLQKNHLISPAPLSSPKHKRLAK